MRSTGDIVRITENGELYYIGRIDNQIKIHGKRVQLEAVQSVIESSEFVEYCR